VRGGVAGGALVAILIGAVWTGQGLGYIKGSFMTGSRFWLAAGLLLLASGLAALVTAARRGGPSSGAS